MLSTLIDSSVPAIDDFPVSDVTWVDMNVLFSEFRPSLTLVTGQCFNWYQLPDSKLPCWVGVVGQYPVAIVEKGSKSFYAHLVTKNDVYDDSNSDVIDLAIKEYFQLSVSTDTLYKHWSQQCPRMEIVCQSLVGVRVVRQDPFECLISFICSSNNNIKRITQMLTRLRAIFGAYLCTLQWDVSTEKWKVAKDSNPNDIHASDVILPISVEEERSVLDESASETPPPTHIRTEERADREKPLDKSSIHLYQFPEPESILGASELDLRALGMGYRARFLIGSAQLVLQHGGREWLEKLRLRSREDVQLELLQLPGVGRKVADCVALFSLDQVTAVPVDTHVWDIVVRDYDPSLASAKSLTPAVYEAVGDIFRRRFGPYAGWAHSVLFAAELPDFRPRLPEDTQQEMLVFAKERRQVKLLKKEEMKRKREEKESIRTPRDNTVVMRDGEPVKPESEREREKLMMSPAKASGASRGGGRAAQSPVTPSSTTEKNKRETEHEMESSIDVHRSIRRQQRRR
eukprot:CAMPEP_0182423144 /NCGR_PEP_ID=MMETSP1167-20130531/9052_1 /TAXON_ID=2988 /ORGANISM="Mallomonas Sp, Strain CCMP3275" /LENGTH=514 /DNA_ID=CAMNT_0024601841 /DNA_START=137 /DNA_END=1681 /DNA_ORIENTATION=+